MRFGQFTTSVRNIEIYLVGDMPGGKLNRLWQHMQVNLCGHATLASAHFLFTSSLKKYSEVEFITKSGILSAKKVYGLDPMKSSKTTSSVNGELFSIELNFPLISLVECDYTDIPLISGTLDGARVVDVKKTAGDDLIVLLFPLQFNA